MKRYRIFAGSILFTLMGFVVVLAGCRQQDVTIASPIPTIEDLPLVAVDIPLTTLLRYPYSFEGEHVRITGQYKPLPLMACENEPHTSPATWVLSEGGIEVPAAGFDDVLRQLKRTDTALVVEGRWQFWDGPVGCGRRAPDEEVWHLQVSRIVSPNPLSLEVTPDQEIASALIATPTAEQAPSATPDADSTTSTEIPTLPSATASATPLASSTPTASATVRTTATAEINQTVSASVTRTTTPVATETKVATETPTSVVTGTDIPTSLTPSITPSPTPSATPTVPSGGGTLVLEHIVRSALGVEGVHYWDFEALDSEIISISVGPAVDLDIALELIDPDGTTIVVTNDGVAGRAESISEISLEKSGEYEIEVRAVGGTSGDYSIVMTNMDSEAYLIFRENLSYGDIGTGNLPADTDHLWNFEAAAGDVVTIHIDPSNSDDLVLFLIAPDSGELEFIDDYGPGEGEQISQHVISESGIYSIRVGELEFQPAFYTVTLDGT